MTQEKVLPLALTVSDFLSGRTATERSRLRGRSPTELKVLCPSLSMEEVTFLWAVLSCVEHAAEPLPDKLNGPEMVAEYLRRSWVFEDGTKESIGILILDTQHRPLKIVKLSTGTLNVSLFHPREMVREMCLNLASAIVLFHNHPSGVSTPSMQDDLVTKRAWEVCELVGVALLDHLIVTCDGYYSYRQNNSIVPWESRSDASGGNFMRQGGER